MKYIEGEARNQEILFPESVEDYIEEENPVRFIDAYVDRIDLKKYQFKHARPSWTGRPPYNPGDLLKLYIYGYLNRIRSSRALEQECKRNLEVMWLIRKLTPDFKTIADFRKENKEGIKRIFREFIQICKRLNLFEGELLAIDSSKFKAVNSKKRNFNQKKLKERIEGIEEEIEGYLKELEENDKEEEGVGKITKEELEEKIKILKERKEKYEGLLQELEENGEKQVSLTDRDARAMVSNQRVDICYNVQVVVDSKHKLIVDYEVTNEGNDKNQLSKMAKRAKEILGEEEIEVVADKGYYSSIDIKECIDNGIKPYVAKPERGLPEGVEIYEEEGFLYDKERDKYICPEGKPLKYIREIMDRGRKKRVYKGEFCNKCRVKKRCTRGKSGRVIYRWEHEEILKEIEERIKKEKEKLKKRKELTEHIFGTVKRWFNQGYFLTKGIQSVGAEIALSFLAYSIKRVINIIGVNKLIEAVT